MEGDKKEMEPGVIRVTGSQFTVWFGAIVRKYRKRKEKNMDLIIRRTPSKVSNHSGESLTSLCQAGRCSAPGLSGWRDSARRA